MIKLAIIADDFTGALDTGIKFGQTGAQTRMFIGTDIDFEKLSDDCDVIIVDSETRHLPPEKSYQVVYDLIKSCTQNGIPRFYKKTDSALRGCVGAELTAMSDALGTSVHFAPALPAENRYTKDGVQYINGTPVSQSVFGRDPFEPVLHDRISDIIGQQSAIKVVSGTDIDCALPETERCVYVYDAVSAEDLQRISERVKKSDGLGAVAGCAGFAQTIQELLLGTSKSEIPLVKAGSLFTVCGTLNRNTLDQIEFASQHGFRRITLSVEQKLRPNFFGTEEGKAFLNDLQNECRSSRPVIVDVDPAEDAKDEAAMRLIAEGELRTRIAQRLGELIERWLDFDLEHILILSGGDTVYGFLSRLGIKEVIPIREVWQGAVLFKIETAGREIGIVSKSGGFGSEDFFVKAAELLIQ